MLITAVIYKLKLRKAQTLILCYHLLLYVNYVIMIHKTWTFSKTNIRPAKLLLLHLAVS